MISQGHAQNARGTYANGSSFFSCSPVLYAFHNPPLVPPLNTARRESNQVCQPSVCEVVPPHCSSPSQPCSRMVQEGLGGAVGLKLPTPCTSTPRPYALPPTRCVSASDLLACFGLAQLTARVKYPGRCSARLKLSDGVLLILSIGTRFTRLRRPSRCLCGSKLLDAV